MQTDRQTAHSKAYSSHYSQQCWQLISSSVPCPLSGAGGAGGSPVTAALAPAAWHHPTPDSSEAPPGGRRERGVAAPQRHWSQWHDTHTCPGLTVWHWRDGACGRCCCRPLLPPKWGQKMMYSYLKPFGKHTVKHVPYHSKLPICG